MTYSEEFWQAYIRRLSALDRTAGQLMAQYIQQHGAADSEALLQYAYALATKYGEGSAELACQMYDAAAQAAGVQLPPAEPAPTASYREVQRMVEDAGQSPPLLQNGVSRMVKQAAADTTLQNAARDGAEFAWVPHGDTCPFCIMLASRGWQRMGKEAQKGVHATHIHANCDCEYAVRFTPDTNVAGYDPDRYLAQYDAAGSDLDAMRRAQYAENKNRINAQKRAAYRARKELTEGKKSDTIDYSKAVFVGKHDIAWHLEKHKAEFVGWTEEQYLQRARELLAMPLEKGVLEEVVRSDGSLSRYCYSTNEFIATTDDGNIRTFFKPKDKEEYWDYEHKRN